MLNISKQRVNKAVTKDEFKSLTLVEGRRTSVKLRRVLLWTFGALLLISFLPWTQNIRSQGQVTALRPGQRPQTIHSVIPGQIDEWFVMEGDLVAKGDTILHLTEVKDNYFDPELLTRTQTKLTAKEQTVLAYQDKVIALEERLAALRESNLLKQNQARNKIEQSRFKVQTDSMNLVAAKLNAEVAKAQYIRMEELYKQDLKSLTDLEKRKTTLQKMESELISYENKLMTSRNELLNTLVELTAIQAKFRDEIAKAESDKFSAMSAVQDGNGAVAELQNQLANYTARREFRYVTAPQDGYITKAIQAGIGETIKEGDPIVSIMPKTYEFAVELYIEPIDLPLIKKGEKVRLQFDGWPAIVFSGWPNASYGTFGGEVFAVDNFISDNGKYRVLIKPDEKDHEWPKDIRPGGGSTGMFLLNDVPIWYEVWRQINAFPPEYYAPEGGLGPKPDKKSK